MTGGYVFTGVCPSTLAGRGYPIPGLDRGVPQVPLLPGQVQDQDGRVPSTLVPQYSGYPPAQDWMGHSPHLGLDGVPPVQDWMEYSPSRTGWSTPTPHPGLDGVLLPSRTRWGTPCPGLDEVPLPQPSKQHSEHLLRGGRYASCVRAGRLSRLHMRSIALVDYVTDSRLSSECGLQSKPLSSQ